MSNDKGKKVLFVVTKSEMGGAQRYIFEVAPILSTKGYSVVIAAGEEKDELFKKISKSKCQMSNQTQNPNVKCQKLKYLKRKPDPFQAILAIIEIYKILKRERPDVLFLCSTMAGLLGSISALFFRKFQVLGFKFQVIYRIGGWAFRDPRPWWQRKIIIFLEKLTARWKNKIIVNSGVDRQLAIKHKIAKPEKIIKIYNGINPEELKFLPKKEAKAGLKLKCYKFSRPARFAFGNSKAGGSRKFVTNPEVKVIGTIANFYKTKGLEHLIKAASLLKGFKFQVSSFMIIGDGPERKNLEGLIKKHGLEEQVFLLGQIPDARKYLKAFDVFVLPSLKEGFPWVILEAMAAGVPIVASKVGAVPEIIEDGRSGFLVEPKNPAMLAKKIKEILGNPELKNRFSETAQERLKQFSKEKMIEETIRAAENRCVEIGKS